MKEFTKLLVDVTMQDGTHEIESVWARPVGENFSIENIPFYAVGLALGDVVSVSIDPDGAKRYQHLVTPSGHSTLQVVVFDRKGVEAVRERLKTMGCASELSDLPTLIAVDVPANIEYGPIRDWLDSLERAETASYREACLAH